MASRGPGAAVAASFLGWTLDAFDFFLVVISVPAIAAEFHQPIKAVALSLTLTLLFRPLGAAIFGVLAERYGRRLPLMIDLVFFSIIEVATGFAPTYVSSRPLIGTCPLPSPPLTGVLLKNANSE